MAQMSRISPCLWFDGQAEAAAGFYVSVFKEARILAVEKISSGPAAGNAIVGFELEGLRFTALDGGPMFEITPGISFEISCDSQEENDYFWEQLSAGGGETQMCGWLRDRFGVSWQVVPSELPQLLAAAPEPVMEALLTMTKIDIGRLRAAAKS